MLLELPNRRLSLDRPRVMGVLNVTPDSFSDGGRYLEPVEALAKASALCEEGAAIIDVGGVRHACCHRVRGTAYQ
mgnify:CR=1 FL=1